jgi:hypothetical protein
MDDGDEITPQPKRIKRDTKSCIECRGRKVKCQLSKEDVPRCAECIKRGFPCTITTSTRGELPYRDTDLSPRSGEDRLERIESLLRNLANGQDHLTAEIRGFTCTTLPKNTSLREITRDYLALLFPSQHDVNLIADRTNAWALGLGHDSRSSSSTDGSQVQFDVSSIRQSDVRTIGKNLLLLALYIQQLPPNFDASQLQMQNMDGLVEVYSKSANSWLYEDDEFLLTPETLESLFLLGMIHINAGTLQKAWMTFRRALDVARMMGLPDSYSLSKRDDCSAAAVTKRQLWRSAVMGESYVGTLLGIESGAGNDPFGPAVDTWYGADANASENAPRLLCLVAGALTRRNRQEFNNGGPPTEALDAALDNIRVVIPDSWWHIPVLSTERSTESGRDFDRVLCQFWFFLLRLLTHLPRAFTFHPERNLETRVSCLQCVEASRAILHRYLVLRQVGNTQLHCRVTDFIVFLATVAMLLTFIQNTNGALHSNDHDSADYRDTDQDLVGDVISSMEMLAGGSAREIVAKQSVAFLVALQSVAQSNPAAPEWLRLNIPYFGNLTVATPGSDKADGSMQKAPTNPDGEDVGGPELGKQLSRSIHLTFSNFTSLSANSTTHESGEMRFDSIWDLDFMNWDG